MGLMGECDCEVLPVTDRDGRLVGKLKDRYIPVRREMSRQLVRRVPIVYDDIRLAGIVSHADLARHAGTYYRRGE